MKKKDSIIDLTNSLSDEGLKEEAREMRVIDPAAQSMLSITRLFQNQIDRVAQTGRLKDLAMGRLEDMLEDADSEKLTPAQIIEIVRVTAQMETEQTTSLFNVVKPTSQNGVNIFVGNEQGAIPQVQAGTVGTAAENKAVAQLGNFVEAMQQYRREKENHPE